ncbi:MAG: FAD-binding protein [Bacteroidales bacterium]|nr:FAD-binding protein [Bacteroidales bacterium]
MEQFDVIIAGAGPAGLTAAVELGRDFKVLLLEKRKPGTTNATWYSYADRAKEYGLDEAVAVRTDYIKFTSPTETHFMRDDCVIFDHHKVMQIWLERARKNGVDIRQEEFLDYKNAAGGVEIQTDKGSYFAPLLIDAMGINSKIVRKNDLIKRKDAWVIYGARLKNVDFENPQQLEYYPLNDDANTYVGIHPISNTETNFYLFKGEKNTLGKPEELKEKFEEVLRKTQPNAEKLETLSGSIVSGSLKKYALDHIIFFGSSGMLNPDGCGMGFNEILKKHRIFAAAVSKAMKSHRLDQKSLEKVAEKLRDQEVIHFQKIIGAFSLYFIKSTSKWDGGVKWLNAMGEDSKNWMRNEMDLDWLKKANIRLHKSIPISETVKMIPMDELPFIMGQLVRFTHKALLSKVREGVKVLPGLPGFPGLKSGETDEHN